MKNITKLFAVIISAVIAMTAICIVSFAESYSWTGTWDTSWGNMKLTQSGSTVTGTYTHDGGSISGTVSGNTLTGTWVEPGQVGKIRFVMSSDGKSFTGSWGYNDSSPSTTGWDGKRKTELPAAESKAAASLSGVSWSSSSNKLSFVIKYSNVKSDAWVGIVPSGTADDEKSADAADVVYSYVTKLKSGGSSSLSASLKNGKYELRVYADDNGGALLARAKFSVGSTSSDAVLSYIQVEIKKGSSLQLSGIMSDSTTGKVKWSSSKSSVASVSSGGKVTAKSKGTAVITAKSGKISLKIRVKVS